MVHSISPVCTSNQQAFSAQYETPRRNVNVFGNSWVLLLIWSESGSIYFCLNFSNYQRVQVEREGDQERKVYEAFAIFICSVHFLGQSNLVGWLVGLSWQSQFESGILWVVWLSCQESEWCMSNLHDCGWWLGKVTGTRLWVSADHQSRTLLANVRGTRFTR
jgi:hypothetical protein